MSRTVNLLLGATAAVVAIDLAYSALVISERAGAVYLHERSAPWVAVVGLASVLWAAALARIGSDAIALAGGVVLGGAAANLLSIALWPSLAGVPDPIVAGGVAFNLADVAVGAGFVLLFPATALFVLRNRGRLFEPA